MNYTRKIDFFLTISMNTRIDILDIQSSICVSRLLRAGLDPTLAEPAKVKAIAIISDIIRKKVKRATKACYKNPKYIASLEPVVDQCFNILRVEYGLE
jgi:hypothetical protein